MAMMQYSVFLFKVKSAVKPLYVIWCLDTELNMQTLWSTVPLSLVAHFECTTQPCGTLSTHHSALWYLLNVPLSLVAHFQHTIQPCGTLWMYHSALWHTFNTPFSLVVPFECTTQPCGTLSTHHSALWHTLNAIFCLVVQFTWEFCIQFAAELDKCITSVHTLVQHRQQAEEHQHLPLPYL